MEHFSPFPTINSAGGSETIRSPQYRWHNLHRGKAPQIILQRTLTGEGRVRVGRTVRAVGEGRAFIVAVPEDAEYWFDPKAAHEWTFQWINIENPHYQDLWLKLRKKFGPVLKIDPKGTAARAMWRLIADFSANRLQDPFDQAEVCHTLFLRFWIEQEKGASPPLSGHASLREIIHRRHREPVNIKELSASIGQSREHLTRAFHAAYGIEPAAWLRELRLDTAETYLRHSAASLDEIARRTGFGSGRQLTRAFVSSRGMTPTAYRANPAPAK